MQKLIFKYDHKLELHIFWQQVADTIGYYANFLEQASIDSVNHYINWAINAESDFFYE